MTKHQDFKNEVKISWKLKNAKVVPVRVGASGMTTKNLTAILKTIPGNIMTNKLMSEQLCTQRHDRVYKVICCHICKIFDIPVPENLWEHEPKAITENMEVPTTHVRHNDPIEHEH